jgi:ubiquinone/menaquinone biosynthesis C-methylase UbiE
MDELSRAWDEHAAKWIAWAREPGHDSYWIFHREAFLEPVPKPGARTLDLGCGEGRLSRDLAALGHDVVGVDSSPAMLAAAREAAPDLELHEADAAELPFDDASFDLVVAFMSLQDVENLDGAISECSRVLRADGRLCIAVVHPINSAGTWERDDAQSPLVIEGSYLETFGYAETFSRDGLEMTFTSVHRPLEAYTEALAGSGFLIERLREPALPEHAIRSERSARWRRVPLFLHLRAVKRG